MPKANPLGSLNMEIKHFACAESSAMDDDEMFDQLVTREALAGPDTHRQPTMYSVGHPDLELRKDGLSSGGSANPSSAIDGVDQPGPESGHAAPVGTRRMG
jgi:hypothetical protein